ncbi:hypothetical protein V6N11_011961 [Hibiscus sabdariffa]|uniref:Uncharacterized protein n=2 Tax=Hibiscus sabdariffa TaxID=183260 RepID=A0ABR1ZCX8_9ROSI
MATDTTSRRIVVYGVYGIGKSVVLRALFHNPKIKDNSDLIFSGNAFLLLLDDVWEWIDLPKMGIPHLNLGNGSMMVLGRGLQWWRLNLSPKKKLENCSIIIWVA